MQATAISNRTVMQGEYLLLTPIGGEPDNQVFRARARRDGRLVAVRLIEQAELALFSPEQILGKAEVASRLRHPALCSVESYGQDGHDCWYIVSEFVEGPRLDEWADALGIPPLVDLIDMIHRVCQGLHAAHRAGIAHDALHPGNLIILPRLAQPNAPLDLKIMDLAVPSLVRAWPPHLHSAAFMAPEQLSLDDSPPSIADVRSNVYSCGALLYYLCTGGPPLPARSLEELVATHKDPKLVPPSKINPRVPAALEEATLRALSRDPRQRFSSTAELANALALIRLPIRLSAGRGPSASAGDEAHASRDSGLVERGPSHSMTMPKFSEPDAQVYPAARPSEPVSKPPLGSFAASHEIDSGVMPTEEWLGGASSSFFPAALRTEDDFGDDSALEISERDLLHTEESVSSPTLVLSSVQSGGTRAAEAQRPAATGVVDLASKPPAYRSAVFMHGLNLSWLVAAAIAGALLGPLAWLIGACVEGAILLLVPDMMRYRAHIDRLTMGKLIARERRGYLGQLFGLAEPERGLGARLLGLLIEEPARDLDEFIVDQKNEGVRIYHDLRQLASEIAKLERIHSGQVRSRNLAHEQLLERMINRYLGLFLIRRQLAAALADIDSDALAEQMRRIEQQLTRATPDARIVLTESLRQYRAQQARLEKLQVTLGLVWERMESTRRQLLELHRRVIGDPDVDVSALLAELLKRGALGADPYAELGDDGLLRELLVRPF